MAENPSKSKQPRLYFGYGSNLWKHQMKSRCPTSAYLGIARLSGYQWIINARGYANVVEDDTLETSTRKGGRRPAENEVWGLVFELQAEDEARLDVNEGVPEAYTKEDMAVDFWPACGGGGKKANVEEDKPQKVDMLVYIDRKRVEADVPKKEYVYRLNTGVKDALEEGVPVAYVHKVIRKFIPDVEDDSVAQFARKQALSFLEEK